jgi:hypothetical protein
LRDVATYVLSAQYGLVSASRPIENYDRRMTKARASALHDRVLEKLKGIFQDGFDDILISLSRDYMRAIEGFEALRPSKTCVTLLHPRVYNQWQVVGFWKPR